MLPRKGVRFSDHDEVRTIPAAPRPTYRELQTICRTNRHLYADCPSPGMSRGVLSEWAYRRGFYFAPAALSTSSPSYRQLQSLCTSKKSEGVACPRCNGKYAELEAWARSEGLL